VLPDASCSTCARATSRYESKVKNQMLDPLRTHLRFPQRKGRTRRRGRLRITLGTPTSPIRDISIPASDYPAVLILPLLPAPELLLGPWREGPKFIVLYPKEQLQKLARKYGAGGGAIHRWDAVTFFLMLAKIARSFAVAEVAETELATYELFLPDLIRNGAVRPPTHVVGGAMKPLPRVEVLHQLSLWTGFRQLTQTQYLVANVRLFSPFGSPAYQVVVGRRPFTKTLGQDLRSFCHRLRAFLGPLIGLGLDHGRRPLPTA
jgi:hypothetical protein